MDNKKQGEKFSAHIARLINFATGAVCGIFIIFSVGFESLFSEGPSVFFLWMMYCIAIILFAYFVQAFIHELGHLVFGLLSGYKFISFRLGRIMLIKESGKFRLKFYNVVGTSGQCLMMPPPWSENLKTSMYNFGGCIFNLLSSVLFGVIFFSSEKGGFLSTLFGMLTVVGIGNALTNGIPLQLNGLSNDGRNAMLLGKNKKALRAFWLQLYVNGLISEGERMRNMNEEWFFLPEGDECSDSMICTVGVMRYNYFFDTHEFEKAEQTAEYMIKAPGLLGLHKNELLCELLFLKIFRGASSEEIEAIHTKELDRYIKATANYVSRRRLAYAYQLLYKRDITVARKCLEVFDKTIKTYPYSSEIENEKEVVELIKAKAEIF